MKKRIGKALLLAVLPFMLIVSPVLAAYGADLLVTNSSTTTYPMLSANVTANIDFMADNGFITASGLDTRVYRGTSVLPHMLAEDRVMVSLPVNALSSQTLTLDTGNSALSSFPTIVGYADNTSVGYIKVANNDVNLQLGDNFTTEFTGYFNTDNASGKYIVQKEDAFEVFVSPTVSENVTAQIRGTTTDNFTPNAAGYYENIPSSTSAAGSHWQAVDDPPGNSDNITTYVRTSGATQTLDSYNLSAPAFKGISQTINSVTVFFRHYKSGGTTTIQPFLRLNSTNLMGTEISTAAAWTTNSENFTRPGNGSWTSADFANLEVGIGLKSDGSQWDYCTQVYVAVNYDYVSASVSATGVESGEHTVTVALDDNYWLGFDGVGDYIDLGVDASLNASGSGNFTWLFWVNTVYTPQQTLILYTDYNPRICLTNAYGNTGAIEWYDSVKADTRSTVATPVCDGDWHLVAVTQNELTIACYVDDSEYAFGNNASGNYTGDSPDIGIAAGSSACFAGAFSQVQIYTRVLELAEIQSNFAAGRHGTPTSTSGLVGYWKLDEKSGATATDSSGEGNDGTITGATWDGDNFTITVGAIEGSTFFNGSVPNNSENWTLMNYNSMAYADNITIEIGGLQQLYFAPVTIIESSTLLDRGSDGAANNGTIVWGENPSGIGLNLGSFVSDYSVEAVTTTAQQDIAPDTTTNVMTVSEATKLAAMQAKDPVLYLLFDPINDLTGIPIMMMYEMFFFVITMIVMMLFGRFGHMTIMVIAGLSIMGFATAWGVYDAWLIVLLVLAGGGFIWMQGRSGV